MKFSMISALTLLASSVAAHPALHARDASANVSKPFYLKTSGSPNPLRDNLYISAFHTGAGLNDAVLTPNVSLASRGYLNGTNMQFDLGTSFPWGFDMGSDINYAGWEFVDINAGYGMPGFFTNSSGLQWANEYGFGGWLVCDWWHGVPQLFWLFEYIPVPIPWTCDKVQLKVEYTK